MENKKEMPMHKKAKLGLLQDLRKMAMQMISEGSDHEDGSPEDHMNKVMVAAKDKAGLKAGLEKAQETLDHLPGHESPEEEAMEPASEEAHETPEEEAAESTEEEASESETPSELEAKIKELQAKLAHMKSKKA